jgi:hypothetical protein
MHENTQLAFQLDPDTEAEIKAIEARSKYEAEQQRIEDLCEKFEGHGLCSNLTPVGDEYDRNWGQCHVCDEWGIVHCDFGTAGSRALCEKHLRMAADDRLQPFINIYGVTRAYGGPEEGGWWYDCGEPLASIPICVGMSDSDLERLRLEIRQNQDQILRLIPWADRYERISVNLDMRPGRYWPLEKPHYE